MPGRRSLLFALFPMFLLSSFPSFAQDAASQWDGTWTGKVGRIEPADVAITVAHGKVVSYTLRGAPFIIKFSNVSPHDVSFGDGENYYVHIKRADGGTTAVGTVHGRLGTGRMAVSKQSA